MAIYVVLLRAIGPITHKIMSMADWRKAVESAGFQSAQTYLATGNMIVESDMPLSDMAGPMNAIVRRLGLSENTIAVVRPPSVLDMLIAADPFPEASADHPSQMGIYFFEKAKPDFAWVDEYDGHERLAVVADHLIVDYGGRISDSIKLPGVIEKRSGTATARNWNTLKGLATRAAARRKDD